MDGSSLAPRLARSLERVRPCASDLVSSCRSNAEHERRGWCLCLRVQSTGSRCVSRFEARAPAKSEAENLSVETAAVSGRIAPHQHVCRGAGHCAPPDKEAGFLLRLRKLGHVLARCESCRSVRTQLCSRSGISPSWPERSASARRVWRTRVTRAVMAGGLFLLRGPAALDLL